jgi:hypothetical protein
MSILRVFPHCDIHLTLNNPATRSISFRIFEYHGSNGPFTLPDITSTCTAQLFAPHNAVGTRLQSFVTIDMAAKTITANQLGTNLVIFQSPDTYITARIQVHADILAWWFGNEKITTALDTQQAHSQPSIYAMFSDEPAIGTDRVGDITGHGFVTLTPSDATVFDVANANNEGRLRGLKADNATLNGSFLGINHSIPVEVVDYTKTRDILVPVRAGDLAKAADQHNVLFLAEGFTGPDEGKFNELVTKATAELFSKPRHEPFGTLASSFNVFKAFTPSKDRLVTCGFQVTDNAVPALGKGRPIPYDDSVSSNKTMYEVAELVARVGLPKRGENRNEGVLKPLWSSQSLDDFDPAKVDEKVVEAWKNSHSLGFLEARDTFFGVMLGTRWADNTSTVSPAIPTPANDDGSASLKAFVKRAYEFFRVRLVPRHVSFDPRRHAPELMLNGNESRTSAFMTFLGGLRIKDPPNQALGSSWVPDGTFKPSRGLIAMIVNEHMDGGSNMNDSSVTGTTSNNDRALTANFVASPNANIKILRRAVPAELKADLASTINTIAHEFGHSFNLDDEYEEFRGDKPELTDTDDNIASLKSIAVDPNFAVSHSRKIDPAKLKWAALPRIKLSARLTGAAQVNNGKVEVAIDRREAGPWEKARIANEKVHLRRIAIEPDGKQLPFSTVDADHLVGLTIVSVETKTGKIVLSNAGPLPSVANFKIGSSLFVPHRLEGGAVRSVIEQKVHAKLVSTKDPLNKDPDAAKVSKKPDYPVDIDDFKPPCQSARLIGIFEGAGRWSGLVYRPSGTCKMRSSAGSDENGEYCYVCKWLITNRVDPGKHHELDRKFYPGAKKNG